jgi:hypothetical protein
VKKNTKGWRQLQLDQGRARPLCPSWVELRSHGSEMARPVYLQRLIWALRARSRTRGPLTGAGVTVSESLRLLNGTRNPGRGPGTKN